MTLTTADLINPVYSSNPRLSKVQARETVAIILKIMQARLGSGVDVLLSGLGKFNAKAKSAGEEKNPQTGEAVMLGARKVVTLKPSRLLREQENGK